MWEIVEKTQKTLENRHFLGSFSLPPAGIEPATYGLGKIFCVISADSLDGVKDNGQFRNTPVFLG